MALKKWLGLFSAFLILFLAIYALFNYTVDPFGIFGDKIFDYYEYNMTQNPRLAKIAYIDEHHEKYDSYIFGCSKSSSYPVNELNEYLDANFYNMFVYGGDLHDIRQMATYVIDNYEAKNIVLAIGPEVAYRYDSEEDAIKDNMHPKADEDVISLLFYLKYLYLNPEYSIDKIKAYSNRSFLISSDEVFNPETGAYNKIRRDTSPISDIESYYREFGIEDFDITYSRPLDYIDEAVSDIDAIYKKCKELGINFILIGSPLYSAELACYDPSELSEFYTKLANVCDFYEFWGMNEITTDPRYFYDGYHFRNAVGSMALAYIFENENVYIPDKFGRLATKEGAVDGISHLYSDIASPVSTKIPILMYHALTENKDEISDVIISSETFEEQIAAITEDGYTAIHYGQLLDYVKYGTPLPEKPILITFDDGYESNISLALPILEKYNQKATVSVIGVSAGADTYKDTGIEIHPHFSLDEAKAAYERGLLDFQSHTFDMHQNDYDTPKRDGVFPLDNESEEDYIKALEKDFNTSVELLRTAIGNEVFVITYPFGKNNEISEIVLSECGADISVTVEYGINEILRGLPQSLRKLKRINMTDDTSGAELIRTLTSLIYD